MDFSSFINQAAGSLGVSAEDAGTAASGILGLIQDKAQSGDAAALLKALPGASKYLGAAEATAGGGGMMGSIMGAAGGLLGGKGGSALSVLSIFQNANMDAGQAGSFVGMFMDFVKKNADGELVGRILDQIPELKNLIGNQG
jgi:hypothetical protein|nr:DUF2780 domain-containing protein [Candidatus Krumholzibacteria bacterium]